MTLSTLWLYLFFQHIQTPHCILYNDDDDGIDDGEKNDAEDDEDDEGDDRFVEQLLSKLLSFPGPWRSRNCKAFIMFVFQSV